MQDDQNPYKTPLTLQSTNQNHRRSTPNPLAIPALLLMFCGAIWLTGLVGYFATVAQARLGPLTASDYEILDGFDRWWPFFIASFLCVCAQVYGAVQMARERQRPACIAGAIAAIIPINVCFFITIPVGLWALVLLHRKDTRAAFAENN